MNRQWQKQICTIRTIYLDAVGVSMGAGRLGQGMGYYYNNIRRLILYCSYQWIGLHPKHC